MSFQRFDQSSTADQTEFFEYSQEPSSTTARLSQFFNGKFFQKSSSTYRKGTETILDSMPSNVNRTLFFAKLFYFWYFAAFGSLFPLMSIYFKQMGMGPSYCGILMGFRPFVEFISAPFWSVVSTKFHQAKNILFMAILSWIIFTVAIGLIKPPPHSCWREMNSTHQLIERVGSTSSNTFLTPTVKIIVRRQVTKLKSPLTSTTSTQALLTASRRRKTTTKSTKKLDDEDDDIDRIQEDNPIGTAHRPDSLQLVPLNKTAKTMGNPLSIIHTNISLVKPLASPVLYEKKDVRNVFMVFLLLIVIGEFFSAPAITLADACTLSYLGQDTELYGRQRMFGSLGWALAIFIVATILDQSKSLTFHACGASGPLEKNYTICFAAFSVCMTFALVSASRFEFSYDKNETVPLRSLNADLKRQVSLTNRNYSSLTDYQQSNDETFIRSDSTFSKSTTIKYMQLIQIFLNRKNGTFLFIAWWMGCGVGLVFTFLFWHLQDLGGSPTLFGVASVINHTSELFAYFFLHELIHRFGHIKILYLGLLGNFVRFVYISIITNPWWVLPFEFIQGLTHAAVWATACSYLSQATPENLRISCQGILQGFHFGFGRGCGSLFGGFFASYMGTDITFRIYGIICLIFMLTFIYINEYRQDTSVVQMQLRMTDDLNNQYRMEPNQYLGNPPLLAPYGAPTNPKWQNRFSTGFKGVIRPDSIHSSPFDQNIHRDA